MHFFQYNFNYLWICYSSINSIPKLHCPINYSVSCVAVWFFSNNSSSVHWYKAALVPALFFVLQAAEYYWNGIYIGDLTPLRYWILSFFWSAFTLFFWDRSFIILHVGCFAFVFPSRVIYIYNIYNIWLLLLILTTLFSLRGTYTPSQQLAYVSKMCKRHSQPPLAPFFSVLSYCGCGWLSFFWWPCSV